MLFFCFVYPHSIFNLFSRITTHHCPRLNIFEDHGTRSNDGAFANGYAHAYEGVGGYPSVVFYYDLSGVEGVGSGVVVVGGGAEVGVLGDNGFVSKGHFCAVVYNGVGTYAGIDSHVQIPRCPNLCCGVYIGAFAYLGTKHLEYKVSPLSEYGQIKGSEENDP